MPLTGLERMSCILKRQPADRIGLFEHFWGDTQKAWTAQGHIKEGENLDDHFGFDISTCWALDYTPIPGHKAQTVAEDEDTITQKDANGAVLRRHKKHDTTPEHVAFSVQCRADWDRLIKPHYVGAVDRRRINFDAYRNARAHARQRQRFFCWSGINVFEMLHPIVGHETLLIAMLDDPDWVHDMVATLTDAYLAHQQLLLAEAGLPDGIWYYEDLGFKERPFMSPDMYKTFIFPAHRKTIRAAKDHKLPVIMHSCGFVEPLIPGMLEAGIDCLQVLEVKAGMDLLRIYKSFGDRLSLMGGIDVRKLYSNDPAQVNAELEAKIPLVKHGFGYTLHSDHSIPNTVEYFTYRHFIDYGIKLGTY